MQIYEVLKTEHARVLDLFSRLGAMQGGPERERLAGEVRRRIDALLEVEEYYLYPLLEIHPKTHESTRRSHRENNKIREILREWRQSGLDESRRQSLFVNLEKLMRRHIERDENQLYVRAQYVIASEQAELLGERARKDLERVRDREAVI